MMSKSSSQKRISIDLLMQHSGIRFGTSGVRGIADDMTDELCYAYALGFIQYLEENGHLEYGDTIAIGGDLRSSSDRIMRAVARAIVDRGYRVENCGTLPSPALAYYGFLKKMPTAMVTGSHIPEDRNGIKFTKKTGEILKSDEAGIRHQVVTYADQLFDRHGMFSTEPLELPVHNAAIELYIKRYVSYFPGNCLENKKIGVYQHSSVARDLMVTILSELGAEVMPLGLSETFVPVDTEAIRPEDEALARNWAEQYRFDAIVSTDGDGDRPLISDETGKWLRGDIAGILCAAYLNVAAVVVPVSCNTAVEKSGFFEKVIRTKIGSPYVIEKMEEALHNDAHIVAGYEANGGFLLGSDIFSEGKYLNALPTRDAMIVILSLLLLSVEKNKTIRELVAELPERHTFSNRLENFPPDKSTVILNDISALGKQEKINKVESIFGQHFGSVVMIDHTDGLRITFENDEIIHLRPSGNAPELRCYAEASSETRAFEMVSTCMGIMNTWR